MQKYLIVICGPTCIGKTEVAVKIAQHFKTLIISADSRQIYKEMSIGTAIPSPDILKMVRHEFIQTHSIHNYYNASMFELEVMEVLEKQFEQHNIVLMAGGSGFYIDAVCNGIDDLPVIDPFIRQKWSGIFKNQGLQFIQLKAKEIDPDYFQKVDQNNPMRLLKAIEVFEMTGRTYSSFLSFRKKQRSFSIYKIGLNTERDVLYELINKRVDKMMENGLLEEARKLFLYKNLQPLNTVGYKELFDYFDGKLSYEKAVEKIKDHSRAYARRQITWFKKDHSVHWFKPDDICDIIINIQEITG